MIVEQVIPLLQYEWTLAHRCTQLRCCIKTHDRHFCLARGSGPWPSSSQPFLSYAKMSQVGYEAAQTV